MDWIDVAKDGDGCRAQLRDTQNAGNLLTI